MKLGDGESTISTVSGYYLDLMTPKWEMFRWADIVVGLSNVSRFSGQTIVPYSVGQHSCLVASLLREKGESVLVQWDGLTHDVEEAFPPGDLAGPCKRLPEMAGAREAQKRIKDVLRAGLGLPTEECEAVRKADKKALEIEQEVLNLIRAGRVPESWCWQPHHTRFMFNLCAWQLAPQISADIMHWILQGTEGTFLPYLQHWIPKAVEESPVGDWESRLANDIRQVFRRYGLDPATPAFSNFISSLERVERKGEPAAKA